MAISRRQYIKMAAVGGGALVAGSAGAYLIGGSPADKGAEARGAAARGPAARGPAAPGEVDLGPLGPGLAAEAGEWENLPAERLAEADRLPGVFYSKRANWWKKHGDGFIECTLCPLRCSIAPRRRGKCGVREYSGGWLRTLGWGNPCALHIDPVEKKPLFHVMPGAKALSVAVAGCNLECKFCQNWNISQCNPDDTTNYDLPAAKLARKAKETGCSLMAFTYSEPVVFWEYMYDAAVAGNELGVGSVMITSAYIEPAPMKRLLEVLTAVKVDLKAWTDDFYREICGARLKPVLNALELLAASGKWYEIVYLVVPTLNDDAKDVTAMAKWIARNLGTQVPVHFSVFHPAYRLQSLPRTPLATVIRCADAASAAGLQHVYVGNAWGDARESTRCAGCGATVIGRYGYQITSTNYEVTGGKAKCGDCGAPLPGVFK